MFDAGNEECTEANVLSREKQEGALLLYALPPVGSSWLSGGQEALHQMAVLEVDLHIHAVPRVHVFADDVAGTQNGKHGSLSGGTDAAADDLLQRGQFVCVVGEEAALHVPAVLDEENQDVTVGVIFLGVRVGEGFGVLVEVHPGELVGEARIENQVVHLDADQVLPRNFSHQPIGNGVATHSGEAPFFFLC